jgi:mercuric ion transport protein
MNGDGQGVRPLTLGIIGAVLAATCCGAPILIASLATAGISASLAEAGYVQIAILLAGFAVAAFWLVRRRSSADCRAPTWDRKSSNHE